MEKHIEILVDRKEYITKEEAYNAINEQYHETGLDGYQDGIELMNHIAKIPAADVVEASSVVEIVHCKECKFGEWNAVECAYWCQGKFHIPDWYCADAESKNGGQNDAK